MSKIKKILLYSIILIGGFFGPLTAWATSSVILTWDSPVISNIVASYKIYYGTNSGIYTKSINVGNVNTCTLSNLCNNTTYYFAATSLDLSNNESTFSNEAVWTTSTNSISYIYVGMKVDFGTNITTLSSRSVLVTKKDASIPYFYRGLLVLTNKPIIGQVPNDGNNYLYLNEQLQYGTNISSLIMESYDLFNFTNAPNNQFYRGSLILTNSAF